LYRSQQFINKGRIGFMDIPPSFVADTSTETRLSASWIGTGGMLKVSKSTSFGVNDLYFTTSVTLENVGDNTIFDVAYMRNVDPDQEQVRAFRLVLVCVCVCACYHWIVTALHLYPHSRVLAWMSPVGVCAYLRVCVFVSML
jgi:hypothetical protein